MNWLMTIVMALVVTLFVYALIHGIRHRSEK